MDREYVDRTVADTMQKLAAALQADTLRGALAGLQEARLFLQAGIDCIEPEVAKDKDNETNQD